MYVSDLWQDAQGEVLDGNQHMLQVWETRTSYSRLFTDMYTPPLMNGEQKTAPDQAFLLTPYDAKMTNVVFEGALHYFLARKTASHMVRLYRQDILCLRCCLEVLRD